MEKCEILHLGNSNPQKELIIKDVAIPSVHVVRGIGQYFTTDFKSSHHVSVICNRAYQRSAMIFKAFLCRSPTFLCAMYVTYCRPLLESNKHVFGLLICWGILIELRRFRDDLQREFLRLEIFLIPNG